MKKIVKIDFMNYWNRFPNTFVPIEIATFTLGMGSVNRRIMYIILMNLGICIRWQAHKIETNKNK
jgi:hypothetical protein